MPSLQHIPGVSSTSLHPTGVAIKNAFYGFQGLGDDEAYYRINGVLALAGDATTILDANGGNMVTGAADFLTKWKPLLRPIMITPYVTAALVDALEPAIAGDATAAEQLAGATYMLRTLRGQIRAGDDFSTISQLIASYLYFMLGSGFIDLYITRS